MVQFIECGEQRSKSISYLEMSRVDLRFQNFYNFMMKMAIKCNYSQYSQMMITSQRNQIFEDINVSFTACISKGKKGII